MDGDVVGKILSKYGLTRDTAQQYIDGVVRLNRSETADELDMSGDTVHRYKRAFQQMTKQERTIVFAKLFLDSLIEDYR